MPMPIRSSGRQAKVQPDRRLTLSRCAFLPVDAENCVATFDLQRRTQLPDASALP